MTTVKRLHSLELFGRPFNILVEVVAGWAIMLGVLSGPMYLASRQYAEWTRRCRLPRLLRPRG